MTRRFTFILIFAVFAMFALTTGTVQAKLTVYTHPVSPTPPPVGTAENNEPPSGGGGGWAPAPANPAGGFDVNLGPKGEVWIACRNLHVPTNKKWVTILISGPDAFHASISETEGYVTSDTSQKAKQKSQSGSGWFGGKGLVRKRRYDPQPEWERFKLKNRKNAAVTFTVTVSSKCGETRQDAVSYDYLSTLAQHNAINAVPGPNDFREVYFFPHTAAIDMGRPASFVAYNGGVWAYNYVFTDPDGDPRPLGGIRFYALTIGLDSGEEYDAEFGMMGNDNRYDVYSFDALAGDYQTQTQDIAHYSPVYDPTWGDGDTNEDNVVDATDLSIAMGNLGMTDASFSDGDMDGDGDVDGDDINIININMGRIY